MSFLRVDREADTDILRMLGEVEHGRHQLGHHTILVRVLVAWMQRRQLDRNTGRREDVWRLNMLIADALDAFMIAVEIPPRVRRGQRGFTQHVERVPVREVGALQSSAQRLADRAAHDKLVTHDLHRLPHSSANDRLTRTTYQLAQQLGRVAFGDLVKRKDLAGQHESPG